ncbi:pyridoxamine 5'-phosphate oxidase family protein [Kribbella sp. NPDC056861]|uniref:pyridoxamine 5'-phosphate oxidase family protein n=1 Tax=Kribbella sp. NPDC056861 TaxID=3154857 RepID=UPI003429A879
MNRPPPDPKDPPDVPPAPRPAETRKADTLHRLETDIDAWVATASADGTPYLMPLSFLWTEGTLLLSTARKNPTALNLVANPQVHLSIGETRDVVLITGTSAVVDDLPDDLTDAFAEKTGFDPRASNYPYFRVTPTRIQAWREVNEIAARDIMRGSEWLTI